MSELSERTGGRAARWLRSLLHRTPLPDGFDGDLDGDERVLAGAPVAGGGHLVITTLGLWVPDGDAHRRIGWHLVSKATWDGRALTVVEADEVGTVSRREPASGSSESMLEPASGSSDGTAVLIADRAPRRFALPEPGRVPEVVHARVTRSVLHSGRDAEGNLVVRRRVPGRDGVRLQIRRSTA